jgi:hypothetical protein
VHLWDQEGALSRLKKGEFVRKGNVLIFVPFKTHQALHVGKLLKEEEPVLYHSKLKGVAPYLRGFQRIEFSDPSPSLFLLEGLDSALVLPECLDQLIAAP